MTEFNSPILKGDIPTQNFYLGVEADTLNLRDFIHNQSAEDGDIIFSVSLSNGDPLPANLQCNERGQFSGRPTLSAVNAEGYQIMVVAKNNADVPLVTYFYLMVTEATEAVLAEKGLLDLEFILDAHIEGAEEEQNTATELDYNEVDDEFEEFLRSLDVDEKVDAEKLGDAFAEQANFSNELNDPEYLAFVIRYFLRKFSSLQLFNAEENFIDLDIVNTFAVKTGWTVYDSTIAITTTNPKPFATDFSRSDFIATIKEMVQIAAQRGWKTVGVKGCDPELGYRLIAEYNTSAEPSLRLGVDNYSDFSTWQQRAESERLSKTFVANNRGA